jgi:hypothetical protein
MRDSAQDLHDKLHILIDDMLFSIMSKSLTKLNGKEWDEEVGTPHWEDIKEDFFIARDQIVDSVWGILVSNINLQ